MKNKLKLFILTFLLFPLFAFSQKAYEAIYYTGKTQNIAVKFTLADGYIDACEIRTTDIKTKKQSRFLPESGLTTGDKKLKFYHYSTTKKTFTDYFILEGIEEFYEHVPAKINGKYYFNGDAYDITLRKL